MTWALPRQSLIKKMPSGLACNLIFQRCFLPSDNFSLCQADVKLPQHHSIDRTANFDVKPRLLQCGPSRYNSAAGLCQSALDEPNSSIIHPGCCLPAARWDANCIQLGVMSKCSLSHEVRAPETRTSMRSLSTVKDRSAGTSQGAPSYVVVLSGNLLVSALSSS